MYQAGSTDKYSGVVEAADTMDIKTDSEKKVKDILVSEAVSYTHLDVYKRQVWRFRC